ncbi:hypothetical protein OUZ56_030116 [Daphnia magna]|uniref:Uncharacterized protein n=1 Tax=Daphnia magna TaxID=35525 RepID=A0ABQ9ZQB5_9CRUS|nr:hypothetical protein OUZ56_030116 [Daphnia magna]
MLFSIEVPVLVIDSWLAQRERHDDAGEQQITVLNILYLNNWIHFSNQIDTKRETVLLISLLWTLMAVNYDLIHFQPLN